MSSSEIGEAQEFSGEEDECGDSLEPLADDRNNSLPMATLYVPRIFHRFIKKGNLSAEFPCKLTFPSFRDPQNIKILANSEEALEGVQKRIGEIISSARSILRPTHFVCLPINDCNSIKAFNAFKSEVLKKSEDNPMYEGIDEDLFVPAHRLHFTFVTLLLLDQKEIDEASHLLNTFFTDTGVGHELSSPFRITIKGLQSMQTNAKHSHVVYASVQKGGDSERLQTIANSISMLYRQHGLCNGSEQNSTTETDVKLHMTVMNSRKRLEKQLRASGSKRKRIRRRAFNAESLLADLGDYCFTEEAVYNEIRLCRITGSSSDAFYPTESQVQLMKARPDEVDP